MKNHKLAFLIIMSGLLAGNVNAQPGDTLNVMTYNLRFGELASLEQMGAYIKGQNPEIVALQECDWKLTRERAPHQAGKAFVNELAYFTGLFGIYGKAVDYKGGYYGVGILSRYPIIKSERVFLPNPEPQKEQRILLVTEIEMPGKSILTFICTHLEVSSVQARKAQIRFINDLIRQIKTPVILAGDFNAVPKDEEIKEGFANWFNATVTTYTFSSVKPSIKIDYIYGYPKLKFEVLSTKTDRDCKLSDHFPVQSRIIVRTNDK